MLLALPQFRGVDSDQAGHPMSTMTLRQLARGLTPPMLVSGAKRLAHATKPRRAPEWEYVPEGWARASDALRGWNAASVLDAYRSKLPAFRAALTGPGPIGIATSAAVGVGTPNIADQNTILAFAYAVALASRHTDQLSVLDWGGGLGYFYFVARALLPEEVKLDYHCRDMPALCDYGQQTLPEINFWDNDGCLARQYDLVFASSSLQYSEAWALDLTRLALGARTYLFLTRVPVVFEHESFVVLQRAHGYRFDTEYLSWVFNKKELLDTAAKANMVLVREFLLGYQPRVLGAPEQDETRAYLFRRRA
jgi:putative methyltransferase (TIGR04325 family)